MLSSLHAHLVCLALVAIDLAARAWRIQWILAGLRVPVSFFDAFTLNVAGDAASAVTPLRVAGEPARLAGMAHAQVPVVAGLVAVVIEIVAMWPVVALAAGGLALAYAPAWWRSAEPQLAHTVRAAWPWVLAIAAVSVATWWGARRFSPRASHLVRRGMRRALAYARRMPAWPLAACAPLTLVSLGARVAVLPVLALTLPAPPALGPLAFASFTLVYGQLLLPTPSGAGVVELGFLGGAVGDLGGHDAAILFHWRLYTTIIPTVIGVVLALRVYGRAALVAILRGRNVAPAAGAVPERD
ncbi:MAG: flippase-like domain-containing protein [Gemmatimonadaceae bacterium]|nr:flippase-like domain-containing protein [Gemmatimonadaceae bacterium]